MSKENKNMNSQETEVKGTGKTEQMNLSDARRVRVLSPGMMVFKRFIRNKLAITGLGILLVMFIFAFVCPLFTGYEQDQVFMHYEEILKEYASGRQNNEFRITVQNGEELSGAAIPQLQLAISKGKDTFKGGTRDFHLTKVSDELYIVESSSEIAKAMALGGECLLSDIHESFEVTPEFEAALAQAVSAGQTTFEVSGNVFTLAKSGKSYSILMTKDIALASMYAIDVVNPDDEAFASTYGFRRALETAYANGEASFHYESDDYSVTEDGTITLADGTPFGFMSQMLISSYASDIFLPVGFKDAARDAIAANATEFDYDAGEGSQHYTVERKMDTYVIKSYSSQKLITRYQAPSDAHALGTDSNGMDIITRLMFGGRISLMVGFVVVFIELFIGVIIGGVAGYFGRWIDNVLMRFIDLFNCIPFYPMVMIVGSLMDQLQVDPMDRIFLLMALLGILGWPGIARTVRGQILSLREQDFMVATEATGVRVSRRIFRHLVPNVMPLLIVYATMNLGSIIISEATLSFLGLGVKYPLASWGSIINAANDQYVLTNYWFVWLPAGLLIVLTVLGFNFVGDGLRDAFDPKMKR